MIRGLDVSSVQGHVDWPAVAAMGCRFAYIKCSEGNRGNDPIFELPGMYVDANRAAGITGKDPQFDANVAGAEAAGLRVGPYHFAYPLPHDPSKPFRDPEDQAKFAFDHAGAVGSVGGELPPMFDFEWPEPSDWQKWGCTAPQLRQWALSWLEAARAYWGCDPVIYTYPDFWMHLCGGAEPEFARYPLCMANYPHVVQWPQDGMAPLIVSPWTNWTFWQFTGGGMRMPDGTPGDFQVFNGSEYDLQALCKG